RRRRGAGRGVEVPRARQVRTAGLDGVQGRPRPTDRTPSGVSDMTEQMTPANDPSVDESASTEENPTPTGTVYNGEFRPDPNRPEQSEEDLALVADLEEAMRDVVDPELGINVVDLGLVY